MKMLSVLLICLVWFFLFRVLCVGGTLVLLLSPQLSCLLKKLLEKSHTETLSNHDSKAKAGPRTFPPPPPLPAGRVSLPSQEPGLQSGLPTFQSSLKHQETFRVSLGLIDGIIHKYVKTSTWWLLVESDFKVICYNYWFFFFFFILWNTSSKCNSCLFSNVPCYLSTQCEEMCDYT